MTSIDREHLEKDSRPSTQILNAFTVDVEDYFQVTAFENDIDRSTWSDFPSRVDRNTRRLLELLDRHGVHGTFFVLGWIAERFPKLVLDIHRAGHEIGSHTYWHRLIYNQTRDEFRADLRRSRDVLSELIGEQVRCFRAPTFSITRRSWWALEVLIEEGFTVDSSIFPVRHDRYGVADSPVEIHDISTQAGSIAEFPPSTYRQFGRNLPVAGGGYFRLLPLSWTRHCVRSINEKNGRPFMFYIHPWEVDADQPKLDSGSRLSRWRHRVNLSRTYNRLESLLESFSFGRVDETLEAYSETQLCQDVADC